MKQLKAFVGFIAKYDLLSLLWAALLAACTVKFFMDKSYLLGANALAITAMFLVIWAKNQELRALRQQLKDDKKDDQKARFIDNLWHDASKEKPRFRETIIVKKRNRIVDLKLILEMDKYDMTGWEYCYLSDILPPEKGGD